MRGVGALIFIVVVSLLLRSTALTALGARGVVVDVLVFATVMWALGNGESWGSTFGFFLGLTADLDAAHWMGRHALVLCLIGYAVGRLSHTLVRDSSRTQLVLLLVATLIHQIWVASFELGGFGAWPYLAQRVLFAAAATAPIGMVIVAMVRWGSGRSLFAHVSTEPGPTG